MSLWTQDSQDFLTMCPSTSTLTTKHLLEGTHTNREGQINTKSIKYNQDPKNNYRKEGAEVYVQRNTSSS